MGTLGRKLAVALVASGAGCLAALVSGPAEGKRAIVQTIAPSPTSRVKLSIFHPPSKPVDFTSAPTAPASEPQKPRALPESALRGASPQPPRTGAQAAPATITVAVSTANSTLPRSNAVLSVSSGLSHELVNPWRPSGSARAPSPKQSDDARKRVSAGPGHSEIVDPWSAKR